MTLRTVAIVYCFALACALVASLGGCEGKRINEQEFIQFSEFEDEPAATSPFTQTGPATKRPATRPAIGSGALEKGAEKPAAKVHEPLFVDWPQPAFVILVTGQQLGYIEPCGCTGLANQKGGLARRDTFVKKTLLREHRWPVVALDVGNQVRRSGRQQEIKFQMTVEGLQKIGYHAVTFGPDDLRLSVGELVAATAAENPQDSLFVSSNVGLLDFEDSLTAKYRVIKAGNKSIGIAAVLGAEECKKIQSTEIIHVSPEEGLKKVWPKLAAAKCDTYVLLAQASLEESIAIAKKFPNFDIVVTGGGQGEPTHQAEKIPDTKSVMVQVGTKGMYAGVIGFFTEGTKRLRYQRVPLDDRFADSADMLQLLASYQDQLKDAGLEGLGLRPLPHPSGLEFVGSKACADCHSKAFAIWEKTPHAHATESLVHPGERTEIQRHHDPECLSCHVTGWNAQKFFPYKSGYESLKASMAMHGSGCENCHGPGSAHVAAENGDVKLKMAEIEALRAQMRLPLAEAERRCIECHDIDNSPDFHARGAFEKYWEKVRHEGKD
jgi:hypothetical protein